jgi:hypothetical protein
MSIPDEKQKKGRRGSIAISTLLNDEPVEPLIKLDEVEESDHPSPMSSSAESPKQSISLIKAKRKRISPAQYNRLMEIFDQTDTPSSEIRENLANELEMTKREVQVNPIFLHFVCLYY